jgi:hypothetical protein
MTRILSEVLRRWETRGDVCRDDVTRGWSLIEIWERDFPRHGWASRIFSGCRPVDTLSDCGDSSPLSPDATRRGDQPTPAESVVEKAGASSRTPKLALEHSHKAVAGGRIRREGHTNAGANPEVPIVGSNFGCSGAA